MRCSLPFVSVLVFLFFTERQRVVEAGGAVHAITVGRHTQWRVGLVGMAVTRAIGDADARDDGVICTPEVTQLHLDADDAYLIVACDGLWDVMTPTEAVALVRDTVKEPSMCAKRLVTEAITRCSGDNITVAVVFLKANSTCEVVHGRAS